MTDFKQTPDREQAEATAQDLGYRNALDCFSNGKPAHRTLVSSISSGRPTNIAAYCLDQIKRRGLSRAAAIDETAQVWQLDAEIVRVILRDDVRVWQHTRSELFINEVIPLSEKQYDYCRQILPPVNHPRYFFQHISESTGEGRYLYFWQTPGMIDPPITPRSFACETTPEEIEAIFLEACRKKCFHSDCDRKATDKLDTAHGVLNLCAECVTRYANAEGFARLWKKAHEAQSDEAFTELNDFCADVF